MLPFTRRFISPCSSYAHVVLKSFGFSSEAFRSLQRENELFAPSRCDDSITPSVYYHGIEFPQLIPSNKDQLENFCIKLIDPDLWQVSFGLAHTWNGMEAWQEKASDLDENVEDDQNINGDSMDGESPDFDEIEDLRLQKKLFYKLDRGSKEYEECKFSFHRRKSLKKCCDKQIRSKVMKKYKKSETSNAKPSPRVMRVKEDRKFSLPKEMKSEISNEVTAIEGKKLRTPTFNQLTDPYHLPFCLDIFITKGSVRACVIHRVSSKVVAVAHSISKDMKFDLSSKKDATSCAAVGEILAQRAIEDDIHDVVYTPRKGDKIEGKFQIVLQSIIDHGVNVKVKLKKKKTSEASPSPVSPATDPCSRLWCTALPCSLAARGSPSSHRVPPGHRRLLPPAVSASFLQPPPPPSSGHRLLPPDTALHRLPLCLT